MYINGQKNDYEDFMYYDGKEAKRCRTDISLYNEDYSNIELAEIKTIDIVVIEDMFGSNSEVARVRVYESK